MLRKIITVLGLMVLTNNTLLAQILHAKYKVTYGIIGKVGTAQATLKKSGSRYRIHIDMAATGLAKFLSGNRKEKHISIGHIRKGIMISDRYEVTREYRDTKVVKYYEIDHRHKRVHKVYKEYKEGKLVKEENQILDFYASNDLLTLYFNLNYLLPNKQKPGQYEFMAVGAEKQHGRISVLIPSHREISSYKDDLGKGAAWYATVIIHQRIFMSKEGRLQIAVGKDGVTQIALLKDLILFGDIRAKRFK
ncbi:MAG: DUF3108 domain-containing protein [Sulfurovum sp.]|nr:DUF3108 domain-containing protein [Sulfurovum sp.]